MSHAPHSGTHLHRLLVKTLRLLLSASVLMPDQTAGMLPRLRLLLPAPVMWQVKRAVKAAGVLLCGVNAMVKEAKEALLQAGVPAGNILMNF